jgi:hypothetical protein
VIDQSQYEEWIPAGALVHRVHESSIRSDTGKCNADHGLNRIGAEQGRPDDAALSADFHTLR